jgi:hypothetical protein
LATNLNAPLRRNLKATWVRRLADAGQYDTLARPVVGSAAGSLAAIAARGAALSRLVNLDGEALAGADAACAAEATSLGC